MKRNSLRASLLGILLLGGCGANVYTDITYDPVTLIARQISESYFGQAQPWSEVKEADDYYVDRACGLDNMGCFMYASSIIRNHLDDLTRCQLIAHEYGHAQCYQIYGHRNHEQPECAPYFSTVIFVECEKAVDL